MVLKQQQQKEERGSTRYYSVFWWDANEVHRMYSKQKHLFESEKPLAIIRKIQGIRKIEGQGKHHKTNPKVGHSVKITDSVSSINWCC